jgi:hypothetical protein
MAVINKTDDTIGNTRSAGFSTAWDFKLRLTLLCYLLAQLGLLVWLVILLS